MRLEELPKFLAAKLTDQRRKQTAELSQSTALPFWGVNKIKELREPHESNPGLPQEKAKFPLLTKAFLTIHEMGCEGRGEGKPWLTTNRESHAQQQRPVQSKINKLKKNYG